MLLYQAKDVCRTTWDPASGVMVATWWLLDHGHVRPNLELQMAQVRAGARFLIIDVGECHGVPTPEQQAWFGTTVFPAYRAAGLRAMINVVPRSGTARLGASRWQATASRLGFDTFDTSDVQAALDLIADRYGVHATLEAVTT
ncbi:MAG: hypothetical protein NDI82_10405 [Anaeromyxobacteraceae bacterium]|nr:hypothetical protein [Anaeromyxobacteraceae bacterium]